MDQIKDNFLSFAQLTGQDLNTFKLLLGIRRRISYAHCRRLNSQNGSSAKLIKESEGVQGEALY